MSASDFLSASKLAGHFLASFCRAIGVLLGLKLFASVTSTALFVIALRLIVIEVLEKNRWKGVATLSGITAFFSPFLFSIFSLVGIIVFSYTQKSAPTLLASIFFLIIISLFILLGSYSSHPQTFIFFIVAALLTLIFHIKKIEEVFL